MVDNHMVIARVNRILQEDSQYYLLQMNVDNSMLNSIENVVAVVLHVVANDPRKMSLCCVETKHLLILVHSVHPYSIEYLLINHYHYWHCSCYYHYYCCLLMNYLHWNFHY